MSGIIGLFDPSGPDPEVVRRAAQASTFRGSLSLAVGELIVLGGFARPGEPPPIFQNDDAIVAVDARIDAVLDGDLGESPGLASQGAFLDRVLGGPGPDALVNLAGDFAVARWDAREQTLLLVRDAFGIRPLFWARDGDRVGFASDQEALIRMGLVSGELDRERVAAFLAGPDFGGEHAAFVGVRRLIGGCWKRVEVDGQAKGGRWFRPERVPAARGSFAELADALALALGQAVRDRVRDAPAALLLSDGRDSASVAVAAEQASVALTCLTNTYDAELGCCRDDLARDVAERCGHKWVAVPAPNRVTAEHMAELPRASGTPLAFINFPHLLALADAAAQNGAKVVLDGEGGDDLLLASPIVVFELLRERRFVLAIKSARNLQRWRGFGYRRLMHALLRSLWPRPLPQRIHEHRTRRRTPPWVRHLEPPQATAPARGTQDELHQGIRDLGGHPLPELWERLLQTRGLSYACPLFDQRVVRIALALDARSVAPVAGLKPILIPGLLRDLDATRRKASFVSHHKRMADSVLEDLMAAAQSGTLTTADAFLRLDLMDRNAWEGAALRILTLEAWTRHREGGGDT